MEELVKKEMSTGGGTVPVLVLREGTGRTTGREP
jgi:hypothetical protein